MKFFNSVHCTSGKHCYACRKKFGGRRLRKQWQSMFEDIKDVNFECPAGKEWILDSSKFITNPEPIPHLTLPKARGNRVPKINTRPVAVRLPKCEYAVRTCCGKPYDCKLDGGKCPSPTNLSCDKRLLFAQQTADIIDKN